MGFISAFFSSKGGRAENEDSVFCGQGGEPFLAAVADGLGMHGGGKTASQTAIRALSECFYENPGARQNEILEYFRRANEAVLSKQTAACQMKTTAVALFSVHHKLAFANIGDSRLYHFKGGRLVYQTTDHSVSQMAVFSGQIDASQIRFHEDRNRLLRSLGAGRAVRPDIAAANQPVGSEDAFLLCSDGFWEYVLEPEMEIDLTKSQTPEQWLSYLLCRIGQRIDGTNDNLSAVALFYQDEDKLT